MAVATFESIETREQLLRKLAWIGTVALVCFLVLYSSAGLRGTDQYWYVADTERLSQGGEPTSNNFFPGKLLREADQPTPNYIMHNSPVMHLLAGMPDVFSAYHYWIIFNLLGHLLVAFCIYKVCLAYVERSISTGVTLLYLASPIALWQVVNPLLEQYLAVITALLCLCFVYRQRVQATLGAFAILALGAVSHPIFIIPAYLFALLAAYENYRQQRYPLCLVALAFLLLLGVLRAYADEILLTSFQPSLEKIITSAIPGGNNMLWHYSDAQPDLSVSLMISKLLAAVKTQFVSVSVAPFYAFTNLAVIATLLLVWARFRKYRIILLSAILFFGLYAGMIILQQNHPRYQQIIAPVSFIIIALAWGEFFNRTRFSLVIVAIVALLLVDGFMVSRARNESVYEVDQTSKLSAQLDSMIPETARIVCIDVKPHNPFSYLARPRDVLFLRTKLLDEEKFEKSILMFSPEYVISVRAEENRGKLLTVIDDTMFGNLHVYQSGVQGNPLTQ